MIDLSSEAVLSRFPLSWSHYARLLAVRNAHARTFYESAALRGGWTIRQLDRQIQSQFYERTALSRNKAALLRTGARSRARDVITPDEEIKDPYVLEFLGLKDDYSETELENALIGKLQAFLLELGGDFTFVGRQHRLRVADEWYRVDLLFFHRRLRCLVTIDLKLGKLTHADAGQMRCPPQMTTARVLGAINLRLRADFGIVIIPLIYHSFVFESYGIRVRPQ